MRIQREELYEAVWEKPASKLAASYGISDVALGKICKRLGVPRPGRGYWAKKEVGRAPKRPPLQPLKNGQKSLVDVSEFRDKGEKAEFSDEVQTLIERERQSDFLITVPREGEALHPVTERTQKSLLSAKPDDHGLVRSKSKSSFCVRVAPHSVPRAIRLIEALIRALEARDIPIAAHSDDSEGSVILILDEELRVMLQERVDRRERELTASELRRKQANPWLFPAQVFELIPTGKLEFKILNVVAHRVRAVWADGKRRNLEDALNDFICGLIVAADANRKHRAEQERQRLEWEEERRRWHERERQRHEEQRALEALEREASNWHKSQQLRAYLEALERDAIARFGAIEPGEKLAEWLAWANAHADRLDPLKESPPSVLSDVSPCIWGKSE